MKMINRLILILPLFLLTTSCQKENPPVETPVKEEIIFEPIDGLLQEYYLDGVAISAEFFNANFEDYHNILAPQKQLEDGTRRVINYSFTTEQKYFDYGIEHGLDLETRLRAFEHLREYAEKSGAIQKYEETNEMPQKYIQYCEKYLTEKGVINPPTNRSITHLYDVCGMNIPLIIMPSIFITMPSGWNNRVSELSGSNLFGSFVTIFNRTFFRKIITTVHVEIDLGYSRTCLLGTIANNRMSSCIAT